MKIPVSLALVIAAVAGMAGPRLTAQSDPTFDVVSVKRNVTDRSKTAYRDPLGFNVRNFTAIELVELAFELPRYRIAGGPSWATTERFDITAKSAGDATYQQMMAMLRTALVQRFALTMRVESRDQDRYALLLDREDRRLGAGLRPAGDDCLPLVLPQDAPPPPPPPPGAPTGNCPSMFGPGFVSARKVEMRRIVDYLGRQEAVQRAVVDKTGLSGMFNADANWNFEGRSGPNAPLFRMNPDGPNLFTALREQLGLRLQPERGPVDVLVIERMERPTED